MDLVVFSLLILIFLASMAGGCEFYYLYDLDFNKLRFDSGTTVTHLIYREPCYLEEPST